MEPTPFKCFFLHEKNVYICGNFSEKPSIVIKKISQVNTYTSKLEATI